MQNLRDTFTVGGSSVDLARWVKTQYRGTQNGRAGTFKVFGDGRKQFIPDAAPASPAAPAPAASPAAAAPSANGLPVDPAYDAQIGAYGRNRDDSLLGLTQQRGAGLSNFGYTEGGDGSIAFDATNPNSRAALLRKTYLQSKTGVDNSAAASGQLYASSRDNAQNTVDSGYQVADDSLQKQLLAFLQGNTNAAKTTKNDYESAAGSAYAARVGRAPDNPLWSAVSPDPGPAPAPAAAAPAPAPIDLSKWIKTQYRGKDSNGRTGTWRVHGDGKKTFTPD